MSCWNALALLKLYVAEPDTPYFLQLVAGATDQILTSAIAETEVLCVLHRKERAGVLAPGAARAVFGKFTADVTAGRIVTIPYGADLVAQAATLVRLAFDQPQPVMFRSLDVIHVSSAVASKARTLVATDRHLRALAALAGLKILP